VVEAENGPLPEDLRINVRYGGNPDGEPYQLGEEASHRAVFCDQELGMGGASSGSVQALRCGLYTQGPARLDAVATGYELIQELPLSLDDDERCQHEIKVTLRRAMDAGSTD
jgi:hypothetical protein